MHSRLGDINFVRHCSKPSFSNGGWGVKADEYYLMNAKTCGNGWPSTGRICSKKYWTWPGHAAMPSSCLFLDVWPPLRRRFCATVCLAKNTFGFHFFNDVVHERLSRLDRSEITNNQCHKFPGNTQTHNGSVHLIAQALAQFEADRKLVVKARFLLPASYSLTAVQILEGQNGGWLTASWR